MPISFKDKNGTKHVFATHDDFVAWLKRNRPDISNPDAFAAQLERNQSGDNKTFGDGGGVSRIINKNMITGELLFNAEDKVEVLGVDLFLESINVPIVEFQADLTDTGAKFDYLIDSRASAGNYVLVWNLLAHGHEVKVIDRFMISHDEIDRTLPLELQHLK